MAREFWLNLMTLPIYLAAILPLICLKPLKEKYFFPNAKIASRFSG
jgi:hypothetical protein